MAFAGQSIFMIQTIGITNTDTTNTRPANATA